MDIEKIEPKEIGRLKIKIEDLIMIVRNRQVIIDRDLAALYEVETKVLNQAVKRNIERFPESFCFQLTDD
jgi:ribosomal protein L21